MMDLYNFIKVGAQVRWNDPENGLSSGVYEIICTPEVIENDSIIPIGIQRIELHYHSENDTITAKIDGREWLDADCYEIAKNDGLNTTDFKEWFFGKRPKEDKVFHGVIVHFTDFRY